MKKTVLLKTLCILLVCVFLSAAVFPAFAVMSRAESAHLHFNAEGKFRILNFSDFQDDETLDVRVKDFIVRAVKTACPDLIVLTGDNVFGKHLGSYESSYAAIAEFMDIFEELDVPVAIVFGNHDDEENISKEAQMIIYNGYSVSVSCDEDSGKSGTDSSRMSGCGTYNVPIYGSRETDKVKFNLWMFDTGSSINEPISKHYDYMHDDQLNWYVAKSNELMEANNNELVPSIVFQHIIVNDIFDALAPASAGTPNAVKKDVLHYYTLPDTASEDSVLLELPTPSRNANETEFSVLQKQGDVLAIVCGHDHGNQFVIPHKGIDLICTPTAGFYETKVSGIVVYKGNETTRGARIIDIYEPGVNEQAERYTTRMLNLNHMAQDQYYTPTNTKLNTFFLRNSFFYASKSLHHFSTMMTKIYTPQSVKMIVDAVHHADAILSDLDKDNATSVYDQAAIDLAERQIRAAQQNIEPQTYTLTFDAAGGICSEESRQLTYHDYIDALPDAQREHYILDGWFTEPEGGERIPSNMSFTMLTDLTFYAHWLPDPDWLAGDADQNNSVDLRDVVVLQRFLAGGWKAPLDTSHADVNADGKLNLRDVMLLRRYLAGDRDVELV